MVQFLGEILFIISSLHYLSVGATIVTWPCCHVMTVGGWEVVRQ